jgi:hypothetical protein
MAHFAQINSDNIVTQVIVVSNDDAPNEAAGIAFCRNLLGADTNWVQTSYNNNIRFRYAGTGMKYDSTNDVFYPQSPYPLWVLNTSTWEWEPPVAMPDDAGFNDEDPPTEHVSYTWNEYVDPPSWTHRTVRTLRG